jgi:hypothetical protein
MAYRAGFKVVLRKLLFCFLFFVNFKGLSQFTQLDQNPFSLKFQKISLKKAPLDLLYPVGLDSVAQVTASRMEIQWAEIGAGFHKTSNRFQVILQNQGLTSNGFVSLIAPRSEFYTTSTQDASLLGNNDWLPLLISHEMRHVHQNNAGRQGLARWVHTFFGSFGQAVYSNLLIPNWLWEGDAIETESRMNSMGRSNIPQFKLPLKAYLNMYGVPSYSKLMGKSYRELVPNHYVFGQFLSQEMTKDFGPDFIPELWHKSLNHPNLFAFSRQFKKRSGSSIDQYSKRKLLQLFDDQTTSKTRFKGFTQYLYPNQLTDGRIIAVKSGFSDIKQLVEIQGNQERKLMLLGPWLDAGMLSVSDKYTIWAEVVYHPRWGQKQQSRLVLFDNKSKKKSFWSSNDKRISPSVSFDSKFISYIHVKENGQTHLNVHEFETRKLVGIRSAMPGEQFLQPRVYDSGNLVFVSKRGGNKKIIVWDFIAQQEVYVKDFGQINIAHPVISGNWIYFNYPNGEVDQIARINLKNDVVEVVTEERWGAYNAVPVNDTLIYSAYQASGHAIKRSPSKPQKVFLAVNPLLMPLDTVKHIYPSKLVKKWDVINPFTWGPVISSSGNQLEYSVTSRDVLNNLQAAAGVRYGMNENRITQFARLSYQAWFPIIDLNFQSGARQTQIYVDKAKPLDSLRSDRWKQTTWDIGIRLPFNFTHSAYQENLQLSSNLGLLQVRGYDFRNRYFSDAFNGNYSFVKHQLFYSKMLNRSLWDVQSRKGFMLQANWHGMPFKQSLQNELWNVQTNIYLPGLFKHDGFLIRYAFQQESLGNYRFSSSVFFPRGYLYTSFNRLSTLGVDYRFPIVNTNINLGRILYVTRLKGNLFGDLGIGRDKLAKTPQNFHSFGVDLSAQFHALRFSDGFELGIRAMYVSERNSWVFVPLVIDIGF